MIIYFLNEKDIQLILEFKTRCGKYHPVFPKNAEKGFLEHAVQLYLYLQDIKFYYQLP